MATLILKSTGEKLFHLPWLAQAPCPWNNQNYERVLRPLPKPTKSGKKAEVLIVKKSNLR